MDHRELDEVRQAVLATLTQLGMPKAQWSLVTKSRNTRRQTRRDQEIPEAGLRIMWLPERDLLEFYAEDGRLLTSVSMKDASATASRVEAA